MRVKRSDVWTPRRPDSSTLAYKSRCHRTAETGGASLVRMLSTHPSLLSRLGSRRAVTALQDPDLEPLVFGRILEPLLLPF